MLGALAVTLAATANADDSAGYALGLGVSADNADGVAASALVELSLNERASFSAQVATTRASARPEDVRTRDWSLGARYDFGPVGIEVSGGQSGDPDDFDADDLSIGVFHSGDHWNLSGRYLQRDIDLTFRTLFAAEPIEAQIPLEATGYRLSARYRTDDGLSVGANYRRYDYDRDLSPLSGRFISQRLSPTTLTLSSSLLEASYGISAEFPLEQSRAVSVAFTHDELAGNLGKADSVSVGYLTPVGERSDLDISVGVSRGDTGFEDDAVFVSALYLFYGVFD